MFRSKKRISLWVFAILIGVFLLTFNTSTRYGRWLFWQASDTGDKDRFAFVVVENDPTNKVELVDGIAADDPALIAINDFRFDGKTLTTWLADSDSTSFVILHGNRILSEQYFQGCDRKSLHMSFSCSKSILSMLVGVAIAEGKIGSLDESLSTYLPDVHESLRNVTIRQLMTMTSGIHDPGDKLFGVPAPWGDEVVGYYDPNLRACAERFQASKEPGTHFEYHDFNPILVGMLLEKVTGMSAAEYCQVKIWKVAGMWENATWSIDSSKHGFVKVDSGFNATTLDLASLGRLMLKSTGPVPVAWIKESTVDQRASQLLQSNLESQIEIAEEKKMMAESRAKHIRRLSYGIYWWGVQSETDPERFDFYANGHMGQFIYVCPSANLVVVRTGKSHGELNDFAYGEMLFRLSTKINESLQ